MSQGMFVNGRRPTSKKQVREALAADAASVRIEATSLAGNEYDGPASAAPVGTKVYFVGPDPYRSRKYYGTIVVRADGRIVVS